MDDDSDEDEFQWKHQMAKIEEEIRKRRQVIESDIHIVYSVLRTEGESRRPETCRENGYHRLLRKEG
jgi:hypothetical protein